VYVRPFISKPSDELKSWAFARVTLGLSEDDYLDLSVAELNALIDRWKYDQSLLDLRTGLICAVTANCYRDEKKKSEPFTPMDFGLPFLVVPEPVKSKAEIAYEKYERILAQTLAMGGKVVKRGSIRA